MYAATEYGVECYCGNSIEKTSDGAGVNVDEKECDMFCGGVFNLLLELASSLTPW
jgi:glucan endo-1,3-alpha-glucosidase